ncbi:DUF417 family protein, partial [Shigella boydii]
CSLLAPSDAILFQEGVSVKLRLPSLMAFTTPLVTLSFLITTPEAWVPALGDAHYGFPYLSGAGRLVLKDTLMLAGAVMIMADSAREILKQRSNESSSTLKTEY